MDIRKYFTGRDDVNDGKSALSEFRRGQDSPVRMKIKKDVKVASNKMAESKGANKEVCSKSHPKSTIPSILRSDSDDDDEDPLPRSLRRNFERRKRGAKIILSSDEEISVPSPPKPKKLNRSYSRTIIASEKNRASSSKSKEKNRGKDIVARSEKSLDVLITSSEDESFIPAPPLKRGKRTYIQPNQNRLSFPKKVSEISHKKETKHDLESMERIDANDFFKNFESGVTQRNKNEIKKRTDDVDAPHSIVIKTKNSPDKAHVVSVSIGPNAESSAQKGSSGTGRPSKKNASSRTLRTGTNKAHESNDIQQNSPRVGSLRSSEQKKTPTKASMIRKNLKHSYDDLDEELLDEDIKKEDSSQLHQSSIPKRSKLRTGENCDKEKNKRLKQPSTHQISSSAQHQVISVKSVASQRQNLQWVDKYKPLDLKDLVGQHGEKSPMNKLVAWLHGWRHSHLKGVGASGSKKPRPPPWLSQSDGSSFKAVLMSGAPGIGKTTCAVMACELLNLKYVEMNASAVRNKKSLEATVAELVASRHIGQVMSDCEKDTESCGLSHVLIMDEVDGMSGNADRAGISELIRIIRITRIPIICICNDRQSQKIRNFVHYCYDIRFPRPRVEQIRPRLLSIACQEKLNVSTEVLDDLIAASNQDVRQSIYDLQLLSYGSKIIQRKDCAVNVFEAVRRLLNKESSIADKTQMFFTDYSIVPLFVQENYVNVSSSNTSKLEHLSNLRRASDSISTGDIIDKSVRISGNWSLLPDQAFFSSVLPAVYMNGHLKAMINFPAWLGRNSTWAKRRKLQGQLINHCYQKISCDGASMATDYIPVLLNKLFRPLIERKDDGISDVIDTYEAYDLLKNDCEAIVELGVWQGMKDPTSLLQPRIKSALTRALNKKSRLLPYAVDNISKKRKAPQQMDESMIDEEGNWINVENSDAESRDSSVDNDLESSRTTKAKPIIAASAKKTGRARGGGARRGRGGKKADD